jgi:hypothetical protein
VPVIEQPGIAENFRIVNYRRRGYAGSSRALARMTMQGWAGDCIALLNHLGIASFIRVPTQTDGRGYRSE